MVRVCPETDTVCRYVGDCPFAAKCSGENPAKRRNVSNRITIAATTLIKVSFFLSVVMMFWGRLKGAPPERLDDLTQSSILIGIILIAWKMDEPK